MQCTVGRKFKFVSHSVALSIVVPWEISDNNPLYDIILFDDGTMKLAACICQMRVKATSPPPRIFHAKSRIMVLEIADLTNGPQ